MLTSRQAAEAVANRRVRNQMPIFSGACVARSVSRPERLSTPAAMKAMDKEWDRLRSVKHAHGVGVWNEAAVAEKSSVVARANAAKEVAHFGRIFDACVEKGSELPDVHPEKKYKGRAVL